MENETLSEMLHDGIIHINKGLRKILSQPYYVECVKCGCKTRAGKNMHDGKTVCYKCFTKEGK